MQTILVVDDDPHIREVVCFALQQAGYATQTANDGEQALTQYQKHLPELVILDILMPELDGLAVCKAMRRISSVPILLLSSRDEEVDRILGLEMGADDYIGKPFSPRELVARVKAHLRRHNELDQAQTQQSTLVVDAYKIDTDTYEASWQEHPLTLTQTEFQMLCIFLRQPNKVFSRDALMQGAYDVHKIVSQRTIDSHIRRLRDKLTRIGAPGIRTVHGVGYRLLRERLP